MKVLTGRGRLRARAYLFATLTLMGAVGASHASNNPKASTPEGFAAGTTGGNGGEVVRVKTAKDLAYQLCRSRGAGGYCTDDMPRIIEVEGALDFRKSEGTASGDGCYPGQMCKSPYKTEALVSMGTGGHCDGKDVEKISYDKAGNNPLLIGSNKTLIGVGSKATIRGKGLRLLGVSNVVIRNLTLSDINQGIVFAGDGITLDDVQNVWIDHNRFLNIGRQMIVTGWGPAKNVTISWNEFDGRNAYSPYCNGKHYWNLLFVGKEQTLTFSNNWLHDFSGRAPKLDGTSTFHVVNNYFQNGSWHALDTASPARALVEGNYFENVQTPILKGDKAGYVFGANGALKDKASADRFRSVFNRGYRGNDVKGATATNGFTLNTQAVDAFKSVPARSIVAPYAAKDVPAAIKAGVGPGRI
ncbi:MAG: polysaccharide lyase family 1 protein [Halothiobacillaceae bacterium]|jgi:pectin lyase|nr:polysaccharide lyase family 1 protein [Halothiobacillaceae bacterium]